MGNRSSQKVIKSEISSRRRPSIDIVLYSGQLAQDPIFNQLRTKSTYGETILQEQLPEKALIQIKQWHVSNLKLQVPKSEGQEQRTKLTIHPHFKNIGYPWLNRLILQQNKLQTMEFLSRINAPRLELIDLSTNYISSLMPLKKLASRNIDLLILDNNHIQQLSPCFQFVTKNLQGLYLQFQPSSNLQSNCLRIMLKNQQKLSSLRVSSAKRISDMSLYRSLFNKNQGINIIIKSGYVQI